MFSPSLPLEYFNAQTGFTYYLNPYTGQYIRNERYARRLQRGYRYGLSRTEARRSGVHGVAAYRARGQSETQQRVASAQARGNLSPYQVFLGGFERRYGFSYSDWRRWYRRYIKEINERAWPQASSPRMQRDETGRRDPRIFPEDIRAIIELYNGGYRPVRSSSPASWREWVENHLATRLINMIDYQDNHNSTPAKEAFVAEAQDTWLRTQVPAEDIMSLQLATAAAGPPVEWWYYH
jgi:hypothetical protein